MRPQNSLKLALNSLFHSKLRSWLTITGIVIGVASVVAIVSIGAGMQESVEARMGRMGADIITVTAGGGRAMGGFRLPEGGGPGGGMFGGQSSGAEANLTVRDAQALKSVSHIARVGGTVSGRAEVYYIGELATLQISGVDPAVWVHVTTGTVERGRALGAGDFNSVVIGSRVAESTFKQDVMINQLLTIEGKTFKVVGILAAGTDDSAIIMPIDAARTVIEDADDGNFDSLVIQAESAEYVEPVSEAVEAKLMLSRHVTERTKDFSVSSAVSLQASMSEVSSTMTLFLGAIAAVSLLVGAIGIANTMFTSVLEKTKEIGIMKAIGARNRDIMAIFLFNAALVGGAGGLLGAVLGTVVSMFLPTLGVRVMGLSNGGSVLTSVSPELFAFAVLFSTVIGVVAGVVPAYQTSRLKPVDALRYE
ncbi:MAG: ABC transporter permease [Candidatus Diapherotrites archaeon]|nr:ABC transporter permease [Candidatus Diapherotrites archaeon]